MKGIIKITLCAFILLVGSILFGKETIYAADGEFEIELSEQEIQELLNTLNENKEAETITKHIVRRVKFYPKLIIVNILCSYLYTALVCRWKKATNCCIKNNSAQKNVHLPDKTTSAMDN